jgi:hypothetical protein
MISLRTRRSVCENRFAWSSAFTAAFCVRRKTSRPVVPARASTSSVVPAILILTSSTIRPDAPHVRVRIELVSRRTADVRFENNTPAAAPAKDGQRPVVGTGHTYTLFVDSTAAWYRV